MARSNYFQVTKFCFLQEPYNNCNSEFHTGPKYNLITHYSDKNTKNKNVISDKLFLVSLMKWIQNSTFYVQYLCIEILITIVMK